MKKVEVPTLVEDETCLPHYGSEGAAGADIKAYIPESMVIAPGEHALVPTGLYFAIPEGYEIQVRPRSGLALKNLITVLNTPGTIDADYRGEIKVILMNHGREPFIVAPGMRIAQIVLAPVIKIEFMRTQELVATRRGEGGFGHTGAY